MSLVADILHACASAPPPWHPGEFVRSRPEPLEDVSFCVNALCQARVLKLVQDGPQMAGFLLTQRGAELLQNPQLLSRFVEEEGLDFTRERSPQGRTVRQILSEPARPRVNRLILALNFLVFMVGWLLAVRQGIGGSFLWPFERQGNKMVAAQGVNPILEQTGLLSPPLLLEGEWWRLVTNGFVHISILHLLMNMYALRVLGTDGEWLWGSTRYLVLYLLSLLGGSCGAILKPVAVGGASGALCGLLAGEIAWIVLNRRSLPRQLVRTQLRGLFISGALIAAISLAPGVSGMGHLGGAVVGLVAALLLHGQRFGGTVVSALSVLLLAGLPFACVAGLYWQTTREPAWQKERVALLEQEQRPLQSDIAKFHERDLLPLAQSKPEKREADEVEKVLARLDEFIRRFRQAAANARNTPKLGQENLEEFRLAAEEYLRLRADYMERLRDVIRDGKPWVDKPDEEEALVKAQRRWIRAYREW